MWQFGLPTWSIRHPTSYRQHWTAQAWPWQANGKEEMEWNGRCLLTASSEEGREEGGAGPCTPHFSPKLHVREWMLGRGKAKCCNFLKAAVTKVPQTRWYKPQESIISQFWGLEVWAQGVVRAGSFWALGGKEGSVPFWLVDSLPHVHMAAFLCAVCVQVSLFYEDTSHVGLGPCSNLICDIMLTNCSSMTLLPNKVTFSYPGGCGFCRWIWQGQSLNS